ncbi:hypothetical protein [Streptomyces sp. NPDC002276]
MLMCPEKPRELARGRGLAVHRYRCEHAITAHGRDDPILLANEYLTGVPHAAACWLLGRMYGIATWLLDPAAVAPLAEGFAPVYAEAVAALETGRGYGVKVETVDGIHTVRVLPSSAVDQHQEHEQGSRT